MPDIFISYSRKDSKQALSLAEQFRAEGLGVWIDQHGIGGAEQWATEIVEGIKACSTFAILLSEHSIASENVLRELSLASEKGKRVLPIDIERVTLPSSFEYPLAGLQRVAVSDFEAILHAHKRGVAKKIKKDERKSLMILPFEDHSASQDNGWFADGLASEMIGALSNIKSLRTIDWNTSKTYRSVKTADLARELDVRYFLQGEVTKFGDAIKVSVRLLDFHSSEHLWQEQLRGKMEDIFEIQDTLAEKVVMGMKLHLTTVEKQKLSERGTENDEAYALFVRAGVYMRLQTRDGIQFAIGLLAECIQLDPNYAEAMSVLGFALSHFYRSYDRNPNHLSEAERLAKDALRLKPDLYQIHGDLSHVYLYRGEVERAEEAAKEFVRLAPDSSKSHFGLGSHYMSRQQWALAIASYQRANEIDADHLVTYFNLLIVLQQAGEMEALRRYAIAALPHYQKHLRLAPDDQRTRQNYAYCLYYAGRMHEAEQQVTLLLDDPKLDPTAIYNLACFYGGVVQPPNVGKALLLLRKSVESGYAHVDRIKNAVEHVHETEGEDFAREADAIVALALQKQKERNRQFRSGV